MFKLNRLNFHPVIVNWIREFLSNRTFQVLLGQSCSDVRSACSGVPQGVLSPIVFNLYTEDLPGRLEPIGLTVKMYADEIKLYGTITASEDARRLQMAVAERVQWSGQWQLPLSPSKTVCMTLSRGPLPDSRECFIDNFRVAAVGSVKDLGFHWDVKFNFSDHVKIC